MFLLPQIDIKYPPNTEEREKLEDTLVWLLTITADTIKMIVWFIWTSYGFWLFVFV